MKIVALSDTHNTYPKLPDGDVLVHAGDFTYLGYNGHTDHVLNNFKWLRMQPHKYKIGVAGNHDFGFGEHTFTPIAKLLFDEEIVTEGKRFYGTPYVPTFGRWAFMESEEKLYKNFYSKIPEGLDVLICHGPAYKTLDTNKHGEHCGSRSLARRLAEMEKPPKHFIFGHIHRDLNSPVNHIYYNGINYHNVSYLNESYKEGFNPVQVIEI